MAGWYWARRKAAYASAVASSTTTTTMTMVATVPAAKQTRRDDAQDHARCRSPPACRARRCRPCCTLPVRDVGATRRRACGGPGLGLGRLGRGRAATPPRPRRAAVTGGTRRGRRTRRLVRGASNVGLESARARGRARPSARPRRRGRQRAGSRPGSGGMHQRVVGLEVPGLALHVDLLAAARRGARPRRAGRRRAWRARRSPPGPPSPCPPRARWAGPPTAPRRCCGRARRGPDRSARRSSAAGRGASSVDRAGHLADACRPPARHR